VPRTLSPHRVTAIWLTRLPSLSRSRTIHLFLEQGGKFPRVLFWEQEMEPAISRIADVQDRVAQHSVCFSRPWCVCNSSNDLTKREIPWVWRLHFCAQFSQLSEMVIDLVCSPSDHDPRWRRQRDRHRIQVFVHLPFGASHFGSLHTSLRRSCPRFNAAGEQAPEPAPARAVLISRAVRALATPLRLVIRLACISLIDRPHVGVWSPCVGGALPIRETSPAAPGPTAMPARLRPRRAACRQWGVVSSPRSSLLGS